MEAHLPGGLVSTSHTLGPGGLLVLCAGGRDGPPLRHFWHLEPSPLHWAFLPLRPGTPPVLPYSAVCVPSSWSEREHLFRVRVLFTAFSHGPGMVLKPLLIVTGL